MDCKHDWRWVWVNSTFTTGVVRCARCGRQEDRPFGQDITHVPIQTDGAEPDEQAAAEK